MIPPPEADAGPADGTAVRLSICIATFKRGLFIGQTLDSIIAQLQAGVEIVIVDGASPDTTPEVVAAYASRHPQVRYFRESVNSGVDQDYDKSVGYARGEYCWLMTDDDVLVDGAIARVLHELTLAPDLVVVNARVEDSALGRILNPGLLPVTGGRWYAESEMGEFFSRTGSYLSFIGAVVIRRRLWLQRDRAPYFGTLFVHFGVIFQAPRLHSASVIGSPLIRLRYGNSMWSPRGFEIWLFKWPRLVWSFGGFTDAEKSAVSPLHPWHQLRKIFMYRAIGGYGLAEYRQHFGERMPMVSRALLLAIALVPGRLANSLAGAYCLFSPGKGRMSLHDLVHSSHATAATRAAARFAGIERR